ncbi:MAG: ABC transporter permease [Anaerolineae bacterium]|nr:ABC transporter permease [Anaerolineae bacterium]MCO5192591.1 ABC transporter permease [Anaerolineae bacterium]
MKLQANTSPEASPHYKETVIKRTRGLAALQLGELWAFRELLYFMAWREIKVRYKQTLLGITWIMLRPIVSMIVFTFVFDTMLGAGPEGVPYEVYAFAGLLPWNYFATALSRSSSSMVTSSQLITKVYFPRLIVPTSEIVSGLIDFAVSLIVLAALLMYFKIQLTWTVLVMPAFLLLAMVTALGFGLWLGALNVRYRDVTYIVPFLVQMWFFLTPVAYATSRIPESYRFLLSLNPMVAVVEGFRWGLLSNYITEPPTGSLVAIAVIISSVVLITGAYFFRVTERTFADVV